MHKKTSNVSIVLYRNIAISFIVLSLAIATTIFYVTFSWSTIIVTPAKIPISDSFIVTVGKNQTSVIEGALAGRVIQTSLDGEGTFSSSGKKRKTQKARGVMTIINTTSNAQPLRATTRLLSDTSVLFRTEAFVIVPARGRVSVPVIADKEGSVTTDRISKFTLPGLWPGLQTSIYGTALTLSGEGEEQISFVAQDDLERAKKELTEKLNNKFSLLLSIPDASFQPKKSVKIIDIAAHEVIASHTVGEETPEFKMKTKALFTAVVFDDEDSMALVRDRMKNQLGIGYEFVFTNKDRITYAIKSIDASKHTAQVTFSVDASKVRGQDSAQFAKSNLSGLSEREIKEHFITFGDIESVEVRFYPFWVKRAPLLIDHIHILFQN